MHGAGRTDGRPIGRPGPAAPSPRPPPRTRLATSEAPMRLINDIAVFGSPDDATLLQMRSVARNAERTVLCADAHVGYVMPIGGVAAYRDRVSVVGVGFDIACGNAA